jgi:hypothetical protein
MGYEPAGRIRPVAPNPSILTSARPLPNVRWDTGIAWSSACPQSTNVAECPPDIIDNDPVFDPGKHYTDANVVRAYKALGDGGSVEHAVPFTFYTPIRCNMPVDEQSAEELVTDWTEVHTAAAVAKALWMGDGLPAGDLGVPTLRRVADIVHSGVFDLDDGVQALLTHYTLATGGAGGATIHMPTGLVIGALGGTSGGARVCWPEGNLYRAAMGAVVSPGPGYPEGRSPAGPNGHGPLISAGPPETYSGNENGTSWLYVSGPVEYAVEPIRLWPPDRADRTVFRQNIYGLYAERNAIVRFDPCSVFAVEVVNNSPLPEVS